MRAGVERLVVAGGDGTLSEVVTGLLGAGLAGDAQIGLLPAAVPEPLQRFHRVPVRNTQKLRVGEVRCALDLRARWQS